MELEPCTQETHKGQPWLCHSRLTPSGAPWGTGFRNFQGTFSTLSKCSVHFMSWANTIFSLNTVNEFLAHTFHSITCLIMEILNPAQYPVSSFLIPCLLLVLSLSSPPTKHPTFHFASPSAWHSGLM